DAVVVEKAEGNPFFVEEVIRMLLDLGAIVFDKQRGEWRTTDALDRITIPDTVQGLLVAHIDRLDDDVKGVLKLASVIGRAFLYRLLSALAAEAEALDVALAELRHLDLIRERTRTPELEYVFKHALIHDAAYESILLQRRRELHALAGEAREYLDRALALLGLPMPTTPRGVRLAIVRELLRQVGHRRLPGLVRRHRRDPAPEEWARALEVSGWIDWFVQPERLALDASRLLNLAEANEYPVGIAYGSTGLGIMCDAFALTKIAGGYSRR